MSAEDNGSSEKRKSFADTPLSEWGDFPLMFLSAIFAGVGTGNAWIGISVLFGLLALHRSKD